MSESDSRRERALASLRDLAETASAAAPSRTYLVHQAHVNGASKAELARAAGVSRQTIYDDLAHYGVEVAEDLRARLALWTEDVTQAGSHGDSTCAGFLASGYRRVWVREYPEPVTFDTPNGTTAQVAKVEIEMFLRVMDGRVEGAWSRTLYGPTGDVLFDSNHVPLTHESTDITHIVGEARTKDGLSIEQAINQVVSARAKCVTLADLHASYRPHWI
jgi:hypothetical protein